MKEIRNTSKTKACIGIGPLESPTELPNVSQNLALFCLWPRQSLCQTAEMDSYYRQSADFDYIHVKNDQC